MLDTHAVARSLTAADFTPAQADALTDAFRLVVEQGEHVTSDQFKVGLAEMRAAQRTEIAEVRTEIANLDTRLSTLEEPFHDLVEAEAALEEATRLAQGRPAEVRPTD
jgi:septal ring factor EnvC (AmiA/AmiB activator)